MNNLKKIGLTALGTALVTSSAVAGELSVTGVAGITYSNSSSGDVGANKLAQKTTVGLSGSTDLDNGFTVSYYNNMSGAAMAAANSHFEVDMGDAGTIRFAGHNGSGNGAIGMWDDTTPAANEESWDIKGAAAGTTQGLGAADGPVNQQSRSDSLIYTNSSMIDGVTVVLNYKPTEAGYDSTTGAGIKFTGVEGLDVGIAMEDNNTTNGAVIENTVVYAKYAMDAFSVGIQMNESDSQTANSDEEFEAWGVSYAVSEDISISYGASTIEYESGASKSDQEASALGISWTNGSMSVTASRHTVDNVRGSASDDRDGTEVNLTFAF